MNLLGRNIFRFFFSFLFVKIVKVCSKCDDSFGGVEFFIIFFPESKLVMIWAVNWENIYRLIFNTNIKPNKFTFFVKTNSCQVVSSNRMFLPSRFALVVDGCQTSSPAFHPRTHTRGDLFSSQQSSQMKTSWTSALSSY